MSDKVIDATTEQVRGTNAHISLANGLQRLEANKRARFVTLFEHGSLQIELYAPRDHDAQTPHTRDEIYIVAQGSGVFFDGEERRAFQRGDCLFVPAGNAHRFEDFTNDFAVWVMFYGPEGGEAAAPHHFILNKSWPSALGNFTPSSPANVGAMSRISIRSKTLPLGTPAPAMKKDESISRNSRR